MELRPCHETTVDIFHRKAVKSSSSWHNYTSKQHIGLGGLTILSSHHNEIWYSNEKCIKYSPSSPFLPFAFLLNILLFYLINFDNRNYAQLLLQINRLYTSQQTMKHLLWFLSPLNCLISIGSGIYMQTCLYSKSEFVKPFNNGFWLNEILRVKRLI